MYRYLADTWQQALKSKPQSIRERAILWRREQTIVRLDVPTRLDRARHLGYKAKQGFAVIRIKVSKGGMRRARPRMGRRPKHMGVLRMKAAVSMKQVAERRVKEKYANLHLLNSYFIYSDGKHSWYEVILVDPHHPSIKADKELHWLAGTIE